MAVVINHVCDECAYTIEEYNEGVLYRYIVLGADEMKELSKLLKEAGF
jgi:hypothetical protein